MARNSVEHFHKKCYSLQQARSVVWAKYIEIPLSFQFGFSIENAFFLHDQETKCWWPIKSGGHSSHFLFSYRVNHCLFSCSFIAHAVICLRGRF